MLPCSDPPHCPAGMSKPKEKVRAAGKRWQGRGQRGGVGHDPAAVVQALLSSWGNAAACHRTAKLQGRTNPEDCPHPKAVPCSLSAFKILSPAATKVCTLMTRKSKATELLDPTMLSMWMHPSCLHAARCPPCQLAELHPPGMALQLCSRYICLLAQLKAPKDSS